MITDSLALAMPCLSFEVIKTYIVIVIVIWRCIILKKRLFKTKADKKLCGVCGGIAEYFEIDSTIVRLAWILFTVLGGSGIIAYIIAALVMPNEIKE